jgi:uncharacterized protein YuzE
MEEQMLSVTYDPEADACYLYLRGYIAPGECRKQIQAREDIILDFDLAGHLIGIDLLSGKLLHPDLVKIAKRLRPAEQKLLWRRRIKQ